MDTAPAPTDSLVHEYRRALAEQSDRHAVQLESILAVLRSRRLDDATARATAVDVASSALVTLRSTAEARVGNLLEPVVGAFALLRDDLRPLIRFGQLDVEFVEPPPTGCALPEVVAHEARAIVRNAVLGLLDRGDARRVRIHWDCDGRNLLMGIRDDGSGDRDVHDDGLRPIAERVSALHGTFLVDATRGWGSNLAITLPLDPPTPELGLDADVALTLRERDVLTLVAAGRRNGEVAEQLAISVNTVKFHVANLLRKVGATNRAELAALAGGGSRRG
ncbi:hypothetical protein GCM10023216_23240 [Isoptericola chiayiensis]|uniref:HTH luxR-type domain-containing protein n=1 Tax=Isoptericola chiayiensis TaxID=579446 RepID=A0ABP8YN53_9MICO|nr:DNA-binding CsgD family transcriptional regulator [Isoptericola chiayiensis]